MSDVKFIGLDVHKTSISAAVLDESGKLAMQAVVATQAAAILDLIHGIRGTLHVTFEEGTHSAWLYDLLRPRVAKVVVSNPRKNALLNSGNKSDQIDARKLAELLRLQRLSPVYHGHNSTVTLKELCRSYAALTEDTTRVMSRIKAVYRGQAIVHAGKTIYSKRRRQQWLEQLAQPGLRRRAERLYQQLDVLQSLRRQARVDLIREGRQHDASRILSSIPFLGPIRSAVLIGRMQTPHRFRTKRQLWTYCGMALETRSSADYQWVEGELRKRKKPVFIRGLNWNHNHDLKNVFKGAATSASVRPGPFGEFYENLLGKGMRPEMARLTLARKIAAISLTLWKKGETFDPEKLKLQTA
jgi:transposase